MGLFSDGNSGAQEPSETDKLIQKQYAENQAEIERKKKDLYQQRLDIIKGQGGQSWTPNREPPNKKPSFPHLPHIWK